MVSSYCKRISVDHPPRMKPHTFRLVTCPTVSEVVARWSTPHPINSKDKIDADLRDQYIFNDPAADFSIEIHTPKLH